VHSIDESSQALVRIHIATDANGNILHWALYAVGNHPQGIIGIGTFNDGTTFLDFSMLFNPEGSLKAFSLNEKSAGTWTSSDAEPDQHRIGFESLLGSLNRMPFFLMFRGL
jgi:hypothetical protein